MPSGAKKRKSTKKKNKATTSPPDQHQGWLRSHLHLLKAPPFGNGIKAKEVMQEEVKGQAKWKEGDQKNLFQLKGAEAAALSAMGVSEDGDDKVEAQASSMVDQHNTSAEVCKKDASKNKSTVELQDVADEPKARMKVASSCEEVEVELTESASKDGKADNAVGFGGDSRNVNDSTEVKVEKSSEETIKSPVEISGPVTGEVFKTSQAAEEKADATFDTEVYASTCEKVMSDAAGSCEAHDDDTSPRIEISRALMVVRSASVWNCCGLLEVIRGSQ